ncbi:hypothetical protein EDC18_103384 [Natranaerovirga pectinivora]|uniref:DUF5658 domain-containing protein n=1 Tax=Natranaerovirga pectinivora TaxID=682400 RepID=A0A4R3MN02_9FIRM|nr:DUF5658 family protein [Natranaerovirga pectinivora]TCT15673.1 hypothetical protein EDC18_103384 [Natranaerovirga pectinivora]
METFNDLNKTKKLLFLLSSLMLIDYILTYIGIHLLNFISEGNPFMRFFMELPFFIGLPLRILFLLFPVTLMLLAFSLTENKKRIVLVVNGMVGIQFIPLFLHMYWIFVYYNY